MFAVGTRVEHAATSRDHKGTVEHDDGKYVRVKWDDGQIGLLAYDRGALPRWAWWIALIVALATPMFHLTINL